MNGRAKKQFHGFGQLGEPATITSVIASAVPLIAAYEEIKKAGVHGLGADAEPSDSTKTGFIQLVKDWWKKAFGKENATAPETVSTADTAPNAAASNTSSASSNDSSSTSLVKSEGGADTEKSVEAKTAADKQDEGTGTWAKLKTFVTENPVPVAIGAAAVVTGVALAVSAVRKSGKKQVRPAANLSGYKKKRKKSKPAHRKMKTIILK